MTVQNVLIAVLALGAVVKTGELVRNPRESLLSGILAACLTLLAVGQFLSLPPVTHAVDVTVTAGAGKIAYNAVTMAGLYAMLCFFFSAIRDPQQARRRIRLDGAILVAVLVILTALIVATPQAYRAHTLSVPYIAYPTVALFYIVGGVYFIYAYLNGAALTWRYATSSTGRLSWALRVIVLGLIGLTLTSITRALWVTIRFAGGPSLRWLNDINFPASNVSFLLLTLGLVGLGVVQIVIAVSGWAACRRRYRQLGPLWRLLGETYPELVLDRATHGSSRRQIRPPLGRQRLVRRVMECRDGVVRLGPYIEAVADGRDVGRANPPELADCIVEAAALQRRGSAVIPAAAAPVALAIPSAPGLADDVDVLIAISTALSESPQCNRR